jgi:hypothetical protein
MKPVKHCRHVKEDGIACGSPALRGENYCHFHLRYMQDKGEIAGPISRRPGVLKRNKPNRRSILR